MPVTQGAISSRTQKLTIPVEDDAIHLTYRIGKITTAWKKQVIAMGDDTSATAEELNAFVDQSLVDLLASWDVLTEEGGPVLDVAQVTSFDDQFKYDLLQAIVKDSQAGESSATPSASSDATGAAKAA